MRKQACYLCSSQKALDTCVFDSWMRREVLIIVDMTTFVGGVEYGRVISTL